MAVVDDAPGYILVVAGPGRGNNQSDVAAIDLSLGCGCAADLYPGAIGRRACNGHQDVARRRGVDRHGIFDPCAPTAAALQDKILLQHTSSAHSRRAADTLLLQFLLAYVTHDSIKAHILFSTG